MKKSVSLFCFLNYYRRQLGPARSPNRMDALFSGDKKCTVCSWTLFTGGVTEDDHEALGHGALVAAYGSGSLLEAPPGEKRCSRCKKEQGSVDDKSPCRHHRGSKQDFQRQMHSQGARIVFKWSCCGAAYDYVSARNETSPDHHADGCESTEGHDFQ